MVDTWRGSWQFFVKGSGKGSNQTTYPGTVVTTVTMGVKARWPELTWGYDPGCDFEPCALNKLPCAGRGFTQQGAI